MQVTDLRNHVRDKKQRDSQDIKVYPIVLQTRKKYFQNKADLHKKKEVKWNMSNIKSQPEINSQVSQ